MSLRLAILLTLGLLAVSTSAILARFLPSVPAVAIAFWRMTTASGILWGYSAVRSQGVLSQQNRWRTALAGIFLGFHFACFFGGLKLTSIANATLLATAAPVFTVIIEGLFLKRPQRRGIILGVVISLAGAVIIQGGRFDLTQDHHLGNILSLFSAFWMSLVLIIAERVRQETDTISYARFVYLFAAVTLVGVSLFLRQALFEIVPVDFLWLGLLGLVPTVIGHTTFSYAVKFVSPTIVASVPLGEPVIASALAWYILGETVSKNVFVGGALILVGLYLLTRRRIVSDFLNDSL